MKCVIKKEYNLVLSTDEAKWLRSIIQNPIGCHPDDEDKDEQEMRYKLFEALKI